MEGDNIHRENLLLPITQLWMVVEYQTACASYVGAAAQLCMQPYRIRGTLAVALS